MLIDEYDGYDSIIGKVNTGETYLACAFRIWGETIGTHLCVTELTLVAIHVSCTTRAYLGQIESPDQCRVRSSSVAGSACHRAIACCKSDAQLAGACNDFLDLVPKNPS